MIEKEKYTMDDVIEVLRKRRQREIYRPNFDNYIDLGHTIGWIIVSLLFIWILSLGNWAMVKFAWIILRMSFWIMGGFLFMDSPL